MFKFLIQFFEIKYSQKKRDEFLRICYQLIKLGYLLI